MAECLSHFIVSPLEEAFNAQILEKFAASLGKPSIASHDHLLRTAQAASGDKRIIFHYTRYDILKSHQSLLVAAFKQRYPSDQYLQDEDPNIETTQEEAFERYDQEVEEEQNIVQKIKQRLLDRDGFISSVRAVNDPEYYIDGVKIKHWPEAFEFFILKGDKPEENIPLDQLSRRWRFLGCRPDIHGRARFAPAFTDMKIEMNNYLENGQDRERRHEGVLILTHPKQTYEIDQAYAAAYCPVTLAAAHRHGAQADEVLWFPYYKPRQFDVLPNFLPPQECMRRMVGFIHTLYNGSR